MELTRDATIHAVNLPRNCWRIPLLIAISLMDEHLRFHKVWRSLGMANELVSALAVWVNG